MNIIESLELNENSGFIFYHRYEGNGYEEYDPEKNNSGVRKKTNKCEIFSMDNVKRISLSLSSFTLVYDVGYIKFSVPKEWDIEPLIELAEKKFGKGLNVVQHFAKFRTSNLENKK